jgi:hypothetical protein
VGGVTEAHEFHALKVVVQFHPHGFTWFLLDVVFLGSSLFS